MTRLVSYDSPPLVEVAMSVQFDAPRGLNQAHLGAFWAITKDTLPNVRALPPINPVNEDFGRQGSWLPPSVQLALTNEPDCRLQMTASDDQWMCQIQRDRLVVNWRKRNGQYPRFQATWERFRAAWRAWQDFLVSLNLERACPRLWELVYVNRIPKAGLWESPSDWPRIFPGLWGGAFVGAEGANLRGFQGQWVWESKEPAVRLYVEPKPGRSIEQPAEDLLILSLTARGPIDLPRAPAIETEGAFAKAELPGNDELQGLIGKGMDCGHTLIVGTFDRITSADARKTWGRHATND